MKPRQSIKTILQSCLVLLALMLTIAACVPAQGLPVIYDMDFEESGDFSGWSAVSPGIDPYLPEKVENGNYLFEYASGYLENQTQQLTDVEILVDIEFLSSDPVEVNLGCRLSSAEGYWFTVNNAQHWSITKVTANQATILVEGYSDQIMPEKNHVTASCIGSELTLLVDDNVIGAASDAEINSGGIGINYAGFTPAADRKSVV